MRRAGGVAVWEEEEEEEDEGQSNQSLGGRYPMHWCPRYITDLRTYAYIFT